MKILKYILSLFVVLSFASCEDVIQVKLDKGQPMVTVDAFINDLRAKQTVRLTYTDDYFSQKPNTAITGASVVLKDLTSGQTFTFTDSNNGNYIYDVVALNDTIGRVNHQYELTVTHQGQVYTSKTVLNRTVPIDSVNVEFREAGSFGSKEGYYFSFFAQDAPGPVPDFYWVKSYRNGVFFNKGSEINIAQDAANGSGADGLFFIPPIAEGVTPFGEVFKKNDVCRIEINSITQETYDFLLQVTNQTTNFGLFATTPENVKTNMVCTTSDKIKVVGWFSMSATSFREKIAQ